MSSFCREMNLHVFLIVHIDCIAIGDEIIKMGVGWGGIGSSRPKSGSIRPKSGSIRPDY